LGDRMCQDNEMGLVIEYCTICNYRPIAARLALEIHEAYRVKTELVGSSRVGAFEVLLDGQRIFSKERSLRFPKKREVVALLRERIIEP
jgi:selT/selW/selH-like putative selenoprotein